MALWGSKQQLVESQCSETPRKCGVLLKVVFYYLAQGACVTQNPEYRYRRTSHKNFAINRLEQKWRNKANFDKIGKVSFRALKNLRHSVSLRGTERERRGFVGGASGGGMQGNKKGILPCGAFVVVWALRFVYQFRKLSILRWLCTTSCFSHAVDSQWSLAWRPPK